jgi:hypothetical protein
MTEKVVDTTRTRLTKTVLRRDRILVFGKRQSDLVGWIAEKKGVRASS